MEGYISEIRMFAPNFIPRGWSSCKGQILSIAQNTALFSLLGTTYGGNGQTTFALPDFRGRTIVGTGPMPGGSNYELGEMFGSETESLRTDQLPAHNHAVIATNLSGNVSVECRADYGNTDSAAGNKFASAGNDAAIYNANGDATGGAWNVTLGGRPAIGIAGSGVPHENLMPYLVTNVIICMYGIFPSRN